jgi:ATP-binding cassette, subfamily B, bacterial HlyB/CyaB
VSALHHRAFEPELLLRELPALPLTTESPFNASRSLGFKVKRHGSNRAGLIGLTPPFIPLGTETGPSCEPASTNIALARPALVVQLSDAHVILFRAGTNQPITMTPVTFDTELTSTVFQFAPTADALKNPDSTRAAQRVFGFGWFIPELLKHKRVWRDVLIASLFIQLLALGSPLLTQVVIDKGVVHRTQSTLTVIAIEPRQAAVRLYGQRRKRS